MVNHDAVFYGVDVAVLNPGVPDQHGHGGYLSEVVSIHTDEIDGLRFLGALEGVEDGVDKAGLSGLRREFTLPDGVEQAFATEHPPDLVLQTGESQSISDASQLLCPCGVQTAILRPAFENFDSARHAFGGLSLLNERQVLEPCQTAGVFLLGVERVLQSQFTLDAGWVQIVEENVLFQLVSKIFNCRNFWKAISLE